MLAAILLAPTFGATGAMAQDIFTTNIGNSSSYAFMLPANLPTGQQYNVGPMACVTVNQTLCNELTVTTLPGSRYMISTPGTGGFADTIDISGSLADATYSGAVPAGDATYVYADAAGNFLSFFSDGFLAVPSGTTQVLNPLACSSLGVTLCFSVEARSSGGLVTFAFGDGDGFSTGVPLPSVYFGKSSYLSYTYKGVAAELFVIGPTAVAAAVPEPATWTLLLLGLGVAGYGLRRRRSTIEGTSTPLRRQPA